MFPASKETCVILKDIEDNFKKCNCIRYAAYRTAAKLRVLQKAFYLDKVQLKVISSVFERHQLQQTENSVQLDSREVESVLSDIYFAVKKAINISLDVDYFSQLMFSFFIDVFDKKTSNTIQVFSFKVGLTLLCEAKPREKYHYLFEQLADHNNCLSKKKLEILLKKMISLTEHLGEGLTFGLDLIPGTVQSCFQYNIGSLGLSEDVFMSWLMQDPQLLVWLSTLYRMQISESVSHNAKCEVCKIFPLEGLRYRCLKCMAYDMCQSCFFTGKINKKHKLKHPVQEYCYPMTSQQSTKAFLLTLRNRLCKKDCKLQYLPALRVDSHESESLGESTRLLDEMEISSRTVINGSRISLERFPFKELQNIILQLEKESERIIPQIDDFCSGGRNLEVMECRAELKNCLMKHSAQVKAQVQRLKLLRSYLASRGSGRFSTKAFLASTPVVDGDLLNSHKGDLRVDSVNLSPITIRTLGRRKEKRWKNYEIDHCNSSEEGIQKSQELSQVENKTKPVEAAAWKDEDGDFVLSTLLGGKTLLPLDSTIERGLTWLGENENGKSEEQKIGEENEEILEELQCDLRRILNKIQELSVVTIRGEIHKGETEFNKETKAETDTTTEVDTLLLDLINGIEKLMGS